MEVKFGTIIWIRKYVVNDITKVVSEPLIRKESRLSFHVTRKCGKQLKVESLRLRTITSAF